MAVRKKKAKKKVAKKGSSRRRGVNRARAKEKADELDQRFAGSYHEIKEGANWFYILPPWDGSDVAWEEVQQHGVNACRKSRGMKSCYGCSRLAQEEKRGNQKFVQRWRKATKGLFNAIRRGDLKKKDPECVRVLRVTGRVFQEILEEIIDVQDITVPDAAVLVCIRRKGTGIKTRYTVKFGKEEDLSRYLPDVVLDAAKNLEALVEIPSDKDLKKAMRKAADEDSDDDDDDADDFGDDDDTEDDADDDGDDGDADDEFGDDDEEDDEEEEDEEDDEEEEDGDDEEDEEGDDEEDDEEIDEDDEEEEEPPPRRKKKAKKKVAKKSSKKKSKKRKRSE